MKSPVILVAASLTVAIVLTASLLIAGTRVANTSSEEPADNSAGQVLRASPATE